LQLANTIKKEIEQLFEHRQEAIRQTASTAVDTEARLDLSLPGRVAEIGRLHPVTQIMQEICTIFENLGFSVAEGPDVEQDYYNFEALNIPAHHPARDMHDTFYVSDSILLRTHTSPMQARIMETRQPPLRVIAPGKVYRCDSDITHTPMFHQVEGFLVDKQVSFADLKGVLTVFTQKMFERDLPLRFRPSFFPFTEPSAEVDIACVICGGEGCRVCKKSGWLEILGSGMIDPEVFRWWATTRRSTAASPLASGSNGSPCSSTVSTTSVCTTKTINASCLSSNEPFLSHDNCHEVHA